MLKELDYNGPLIISLHVNLMEPASEAPAFDFQSAAIPY
jgi:hypothetical protein